MALLLENVSFFYGDRLVFKNVNFEAHPASATILTGGNGAGKSTLLKIMAGLLKPFSGSVKNDFVRCGYCGHLPQIYPDLTALANLAFWAQFNKSGWNRKDCEDALEEVGLGAWAHEKVGSFSRGMQQMLDLAIAFCGEPELVLLDEPTTGLDNNACGIFFKLLRSRTARGTAVVWSSHKLDDERVHADSVAVLKDARLDVSCVLVKPSLTTGRGAP